MNVYTEPDWVISARLMWGLPPGREPARSEVNLAVWIMLDRGHDSEQIALWTRIPLLAVLQVMARRRLALEPDPPGPPPRNRPSRQQRAREWAPTDYQRWVLSGVGESTKLQSVTIPAPVTDRVPELVS